MECIPQGFGDSIIVSQCFRGYPRPIASIGGRASLLGPYFLPWLGVTSRE